MASDVTTLCAHKSIPPGKRKHAADPGEEILDYKKIIGLRNEIYTGKHPRFKPSSILSRPAPPKFTDPKPTPPIPPRTNNLRLPPVSTSNPSHKNASASSTMKSRYSSAFLTKSEVLFKAEIALKRKRIEQGLKQQLEERDLATKFEMDVKGGVLVGAKEIDLASTLNKASLNLESPERPDDAAFVDQLKCFYGEHPVDHLCPTSIRTRVDAGSKKEVSQNDLHSNEILTMGRLEAVPTNPSSSQSMRDVEALPQSDHDLITRADGSFRGGDHSQDSHPMGSTKFIRNSTMHSTASQQESMRSPQPHYSATNQVRSPAAPQPVRPANAAQVESQDHLLQIESGEYSELRQRSPSPQNILSFVRSSGRKSPSSSSKRQATSLGWGEALRRPISPERIAVRPQSRDSMYGGGRFRDRPQTPVYNIRYQPPPPLPPRHHYQLLYQDERYPFAPQPVRFGRSYAPGYLSRPPHSPYHSPYYFQAPLYEGPFAGFSSRSSIARHISDRRSASPSSAVQRMRRVSRSVSPLGRRSRRPSLEDRGSPRLLPPSVDPSQSPKGRRMPRVEVVSVGLKDPEPHHVGPHCASSQGRPYYDNRDPYSPPPFFPAHPLPLQASAPSPQPPHSPLPRRFPEETFVSPHDSSLQRDDGYRNYRDREYPIRPIHTLAASPYHHDFIRAPSRAIIGHAREDYNGRPNIDYHGRIEERDFGRRESIRSDERIYLSRRQESVRPEMPALYDERGHRPASTRPGMERQHSSLPASSGFGPYGSDGYRRY